MRLVQSKKDQITTFYKDDNYGKLLFTDTHGTRLDKTEEIIEALDYKRSYIGKILINAENKDKNSKGQNLFKDFINKLVNNEKLEQDLIRFSYKDKEKAKNEKELKALIYKYVSSFGRNLRYDEDSPTLETLLIKYYNNENIDEDFKLLQERIQSKIDNRKRYLKTSINKNKITFNIEGNELKPSNNKMKWLFSLLTKDGVDKKTFDIFSNEYKQFKYNKDGKTYCGLEEVLKEISDNFFKGEVKNKKFPTRVLYLNVLSFNDAFLAKYEGDKNVYESYKYFIFEIMNYYKKYFPVKSKSSTDKKREKLSVKKNVEYYISNDFMLNEVWRHIVNQLVQGLIQYGKLKHYYYNKNGWQKHEINSDGLTKIQIEEAFKKQMFLSVGWGATRLNYFFNFGSQNNPENNKSEGDIFLADAFRNNYYEFLINNKESDNTQTEIIRLRNKLSTCFPINESDSTETLIQLLETTDLCLYNIRNNIFHYKNTKVCDILNETITVNNNPYYNIEIAKKLINRDIDSLQSQFKERIRGSGLTDYYSLDTLKKVFAEDKIQFHLYAPQFPMFPAFKKVFTRGCNLKNDGIVKWYRDDLSQQDSQANLVYKNLLQLIYYNSFLPDIIEDESLVTNWINKIIYWNKDKAKNNKNKHQYKYENMPKYKSGTKLKDYLENLWRLQSLKENEESKPESKKNYYVDFVVNIFVKAFNEYLEGKLKSEFDDLMSPTKQNIEENKNVSEISLDKLCGKCDSENNTNNSIITIKHNIKKDIKCIGLYLLLRLLDSRELNKLLHQFIRYRTSTKLNVEDFIEFEELITLVQFTIPNPKVDDFYKKSMEKHFKMFIDGDPKTQYNNFYYDDNSDEDKKAPILHKSAYMVARSGALPLYCDMFAKSKLLYQINNSDFNKYCEKTNFGKINDTINNTTSPIEDVQKNLESLHSEIIELNNDISEVEKEIRYLEKQKIPQKEKINQLKIKRDNILEKIEDKSTEYKKLNNDIQYYNNLSRKLTFESLYRVHQLHVDILSRLASFAEDWERDMFFLLTALNSVNDSYKNIDVDKIFNEGEVVAKLTEVLKDNKIREIFNKLCWCHETFGSAKEIEKRLFVRNSVAHFNHMSQYGEHGIQPNIIELINKMRFLLAYDIKRQNSVTKVIKDLIESEYKVCISFSRMGQSSNEFKLNEPKASYLIHLKGCYVDKKKDKGIKFPAQDKFMRKLVEQLLIFKYSNNDKQK